MFPGIATTTTTDATTTVAGMTSASGGQVRHLVDDSFPSQLHAPDGVSIGFSTTHAARYMTIQYTQAQTTLHL